MSQKKIIKYIVSFLGVLLAFYIFSYDSYALATGSVYLSSDKSVFEKGEDVEIAVNIENCRTAAFNFSLYFDSTKLEFVSGFENINVVGDRVICVWYDGTGGKNAKNGKLGALKFRAKEDGLVTFQIEGEFYSEVGQKIQTDFKEVQVQIGKEDTKLEKEAKEEQGKDDKSNNATLQVLRLGKEGIVPNFESDIYEYYLTISNSVNEIELIAIAENPNTTVEVIGNKNLKEGLNLIKIIVTSEDRTQSNTYTIQVTKTADLEAANTNLEILAVENVLLNPPFNNSVTHYKIEVANEIDSLNILAVPENEKGSVKVTGKENLQVGENTVYVVVTAPNGFTKKEYVIGVYRRSLEEERAYEDEQKENQNKLEEIYKTQEMSALSNNTEESVEEDEKNSNWLEIIIILVASIIIIFVVYKYGIKNMKNNIDKKS